MPKDFQTVVAIVTVSIVMGIVVGCAPEGSGVTTNVVVPDTSAFRKSGTPSHPESLVGHWRWHGDSLQHLILHQDGTAAKGKGHIGNMHRKGVWRVRDDGMLEVIIKMLFQIERNTETSDRSQEFTLLDFELKGNPHDLKWIKTKDDSFATQDEATAASHSHPMHLVGRWQWRWSDQYLTFLDNGTANSGERRADRIHRNGLWRVRDDGILEVAVTIEFRIDDVAEAHRRKQRIELMDIETIPTDHDFAWIRHQDYLALSRTAE